MTRVRRNTDDSSSSGFPMLRQAPRKASAYVAEYLMTQLFNGELRSGDRLDVEAITAVLGVSHAPVREAIVVLERDGVLETRYHRGVFVAPFTFASIVEGFELYGLLSGLAASKVARDQEEETIAALDTTARRLRAADSREEQASLHWTIRSIIHHQGASPRLQSLLRNFGGSLPASFHLIDAAAAEEDSKNILKVVRAIRAAKPKEAAEIDYQMSSRIGWRIAKLLDSRGLFEPTTGKTPERDQSDSDDRQWLLRRLLEQADA